MAILNGFLYKIRGLKCSFLIWLENIVFLQSVCILASTPILYGWGMPCSKASVFGNILFSPFMAFFIILSGLIFIFGLFGLQPKIIFSTFELFIKFWHRLLTFGSHGWLAIPDVFLMFFWGFGIFGVAFLIARRFHRSIVRYFCITWMVVFSLFLISPLHQKLFDRKDKTVVSFTVNSKNLIFKRTSHGKLLCIDDGQFGKSQEPEKFVLYKFRPFLLSNFGTLDLNCLVLKRLSRRALRAALACCQFLNLLKVEVHGLESDYYGQYKDEIDHLLEEISNKTEAIFKR